MYKRIVSKIQSFIEGPLYTFPEAGNDPVSMRGGGTPVGMEHLLRLQKIRLYSVDSGDATIVSVFRNALSVHPNCPSVEHFR